MKIRSSQLALALPFVLALNASAVTRYVDLNSANPTPPYINWATAATNIQDAMDTADLGDEVLVMDGVYKSGGTVVGPGLVTNRVVVTKAVTVKSVNGPEFTIIEGYQVPGTTNGPAAIRCVYLTSGAVLSGFTLTNGATQTSGDSGKDRSGGGVWCESASVVVSNCVLTGNSADYYGGGALNGTLNNCTLTDNSTTYGGGAYGSALNNCRLTGNSASAGGGANVCTLNNCTVTGNSAYEGGGASDCTLNNCIVYYNTASSNDPNYQSATLNYCCTTPMPDSGTDNLTTEPQLASSSHLSASSLCRGAGSAVYATGVDLDGELWVDPPSIGCDEYRSGSVTGALSVTITASYTNVAVGFPVDFQGLIEGRVSASRWDFGDGVVVSNRPWATHAWEAAGDYVVELRAYNEDFPGGVVATFVVHVLAQPIYYVSLTSTNPTSPYTNWTMAATNIQDAVDASIPGAVVLVSNGVYEAGARAVYGMSNRVAVTKPVTVRSVNGPTETTIHGYQMPGSTNGIAAVRCVYLTSGAVLDGFTLTKGATQTDGDLYQNQSGGGVWCEVNGAVLTNCVLTGNSAFYYGGGSMYGTLNNCTLTDNSSYAAGGAFVGTLNNCTLSGNLASNGGGGANGSTLNNCTLTGNSASYGGGASGGTLNNCSLTGNSAASGGGAHSVVANNCTIAGNLATLGGGVYSSSSKITNCVIYHNVADTADNYFPASVVMDQSCASPLPSGVGNISDDPNLSDGAHLTAGSPCRGAGNPASITGVDIDGEAWANPPSMGCDEYNPGATGPLQVAIRLVSTNLLTGWTVKLLAFIDGHASSNRWVFDDGTAATNVLSVAHVWTNPGDYAVVLTVFNDSNPGGISATGIVQIASPPIHYVNLNGSNPIPPFTNWSTAATNIQSAVDVAGTGAVILVTNGVYETGGRRVSPSPTTNRVVIAKVVTVQSVNGPGVTFIKGRQVAGTTNGVEAVRCVYLGNGAVLTGFTLTNGATRSASLFANDRNGGGILCESSSAVVSNCTLIGNSAADRGGGAYPGTLNNCLIKSNTAGSGGGVSSGVLNTCVLSGNRAGGGGGVSESLLNSCVLSNNVASTGGGAGSSTLNNCLLKGNLRTQSGSGGGAHSGTLNNCTLIENHAEGAIWSTLNNCISYYNNGDNHYLSTVNFCCTTPLPATGNGNFTNAPRFINQAGGDFRLQTNSPCVNAGQNAYVASSTDLEGSLRIAGGTVDIGAYEFQGTGLNGFSGWLWQHGLRTDETADHADSDTDGANNWQEWRADTNPTNALSVLRMVNATNGPAGLDVTWQSVSTRNYFLERATNLGIASPFQNVVTNIAGVVGSKTYTDTTATNGGPYFYRVGVQ